MNFYKILSFATGKKLPPRIKVLGLLTLHLLRKRTVAVFLDTSTGCNLRCRMCYFSNPEHDSKARSIETDRLLHIARAFYHRALKLQIGCGTEPTLYRGLEDIIRQGKAAGIPFISITTNGQIFANDPAWLERLIAAGLDELTLSAHGTRPETYEYLMPGAHFDRFVRLVETLAELKQRYPQFKVRLNFTFNSMNIEDLSPDSFWGLWKNTRPDIIQLRPVQNIGGTAWTDYSMDKVKTAYEHTIARLTVDCRQKGITVIAPEERQLDMVNDEQDWSSAVIEDLTYCYVSPDAVYKSDFAPGIDTYESYHRRKHTSRALLKSVFFPRGRKRSTSKKLNYTVR